MNLSAFKGSLARDKPPTRVSRALEALWWDAKGDWDKAHGLAQDAGAAGAWVHAYLHRKEGDIGNARYWYGQAGRKPVADAPFEAEWEEIARTLLEG
jgi:hypothetical protein